LECRKFDIKTSFIFLYIPQMYEYKLLFPGEYLDPSFADKWWIKFRPLCDWDFEKWFCDVLWELTSCNTNKQKFLEIFEKMYAINQIEPQYLIIVWEDINNWKIASCWSIIIENKFIHEWHAVGHIEDIVISKEYRWKWLWEHIISILKDIANKNCYKVILDCDEKNLWFYEKCWFSQKSLWLAKYF